MEKKIDIWVPGQPMPKFEFSFVDWITDTIAISSIDQAESEDAIREDKIRYMVSIGELYPEKPDVLRHVVFRTVRDNDPGVSIRTISEIVQAIKECSAEGKTLVHCTAGVSRSPGFVALYLAIEEGLSWEEAKAKVKAKRTQMNVQPLTDAMLQSYLCEHALSK